MANVKPARHLRQAAAVAECSSDAIIVVTLEGVVVVWNASAERLYGYRANEVIGRSLTLLLPPERMGEIGLLLDQVAGGERVRGFDTVGVTRDGRRTGVQLSLSPLAEANGVVCGAAVIAREVRGGPEAEVLSQARAAYDQGQIGSSPDGVVAVGADLVIIGASESLCRMVGRARSELIGAPFPECFADPARAADSVRLALDQGSVRDHALALRRADGREMEISFDAMAQGDPVTGVRGVFAAVRDVTERKRTEKALRESQARFRSVVQALGEGVIVQKANGEVIECNEAAQRIMGLTREQILSGDWGGRPPVLFHDDGSPMRMPDPTHPALRTLRTGQPTRGVVLGMDLSDSTRKWMIMNAEPMLLPGEEEPFAVVTSLADITDYRRTQEALRVSRERALHDELTGLPNRALLFERLQAALTRARRHGSIVALLFLDLDDFKAVNDSLGHQVGDEYLVKVGKRLVGILRGSDTAARIGGDEFVVLCEDLDDPAEAGVLAERIQHRLAVEIPLQGKRVSAPASIGIAISHVGSTPEALLRDADAAMYVAKRGGGRRWETADDALHAAALRVLTVEGDLRRAIERGELDVHYQPIIDLETDRVVAVEALLRWQHPERGLIPPTEFLGIAEQRGLITDIGSWVLTTASDTAAGWTRRFGPFAPVLAVNVSSRQLGNRSMTELVTNTLTRTGLSPDRLRLEITETQLVAVGTSAMSDLQGLSATGVKLAVDDFGTGYAGFDYLRRLPLNELKIDKSFVDGVGSDPTDTAIASGIITLGRSLGLAVVAEGIQTTRQRDVLADLGCVYGQGWLWYPAVPGEQIASMLRTGACAPGRKSHPRRAGPSEWHPSPRADW